jgi:hypothetical protein
MNGPSGMPGPVSKTLVQKLTNTRRTSRTSGKLFSLLWQVMIAILSRVLALLLVRGLKQPNG